MLNMVSAIVLSSAAIVVLAGKLVVHWYVGGGSHLQPLPGCCLILLPPQHLYVTEVVEQLWGFKGHFVCFPLFNFDGV